MLVVFGIHTLAFGFADLLKNHLLCHLGRDASKDSRRFLKFDLSFHLHIRLDRAGLVQ